MIKVRGHKNPQVSKAIWGPFERKKKGMVFGISVRLPRGMASDLLKLILYPENELNNLIVLTRGGIDVSGDVINNKTSSA